MPTAALAGCWLFGRPRRSMLPRCDSAPLRSTADRTWVSGAERARAEPQRAVGYRPRQAGTERSPGAGRGWHSRRLSLRGSRPKHNS
eukprot:3176125-Alexandrium_andersonii.AAC.1